MIRRPPRSTLDRSSAASDVYKRQQLPLPVPRAQVTRTPSWATPPKLVVGIVVDQMRPVSYTHLRAHETVLDLVCRLLLEKKKHQTPHTTIHQQYAKKLDTSKQKQTYKLSNDLSNYY